MASVATVENRVVLEPFLKWAGGKRWFAARHLDLLPQNFERLLEPFLGSGAMFFALQPEMAIVSDLNVDLIDCYEAVRDDPSAITEGLRIHQKKHSKDHYYAVRGTVPGCKIERAVRFLYLNRTCWNGLYRVNKKNEFNVPIGTKSSVILASDDFHAVSVALKSAKIMKSDFELTLAGAGPGDFAFVDPPYTVKHNLNGFLKYNDKIFSWEDQVRLRDAVQDAAKRGAKVLVTNGNHTSVQELYANVGRMDVVSRASVLAANSRHRSATSELVIRTWLR